MSSNSFHWDRNSHPSSALFKPSDGSFKGWIARRAAWLDSNFQLDLGLQPRLPLVSKPAATANPSAVVSLCMLSTCQTCSGLNIYPKTSWSNRFSLFFCFSDLGFVWSFSKGSSLMLHRNTLVVELNSLKYGDLGSAFLHPIPKAFFRRHCRRTRIIPRSVLMHQRAAQYV